MKSRLNLGKLATILLRVFSLPVSCLKTTILHTVLCGCQSTSVTLREEHRLRVFQYRVLRSFINCTLQGDHVAHIGRGEMHTEFGRKP